MPAKNDICNMSFKYGNCSTFILFDDKIRYGNYITLDAESNHGSHSVLDGIRKFSS